MLAAYGYIDRMEVMELFEEIRPKPANRNPAAMAREAIQVAAVAMRFAAQICGGRP